LLSEKIVDIDTRKAKVYRASLEKVNRQLEGWLKWANDHADRIDPLKNRLPLESENDKS